MGSLTDVGEELILEHALKNTVQAVPSNVQIALSSADPGDDGSGLTEPVGGNYSRRTHNVWEVNALRQVRNDGEIEFDAADGSWGDPISHWAIFLDANQVAYGEFNTPRSVGAGDVAKIPDNDLVITFLDGSASLGGISNFLATKMWEHFFKITPYDTSGLNLYIAALDTLGDDNDDGDDIAGKEPGSGVGYARELHNTWRDAVTSGGYKLCDNAGAIAMGPASGAGWGTIVGVAILESLTSGELFFYGQLSVAKTINNGDTLNWPIGDLNVRLR